MLVPQFLGQPFKYVGEKSDSDTGSGRTSGEATTGIQIERHGFRNNSEKKYITIKIEKLTGRNWYFNPGFYKFKTVYDSGKKSYANKRYEYCVFPYKNKDNRYFLVKALGRLSGPKNKTKLQIIYEKSVDGQWGGLGTLSVDQREELNSFIADSEKDIQIIE